VTPFLFFTPWEVGGIHEVIISRTGLTELPIHQLCGSTLRISGTCEKQAGAMTKQKKILTIAFRIVRKRCGFANRISVDTYTS